MSSRNFTFVLSPNLKVNEDITPCTATSAEKLAFKQEMYKQVQSIFLWKLTKFQAIKTTWPVTVTKFGFRYNEAGKYCNEQPFDAKETE